MNTIKNDASVKVNETKKLDDDLEKFVKCIALGENIFFRTEMPRARVSVAANRIGSFRVRGPLGGDFCRGFWIMKTKPNGFEGGMANPFTHIESSINYSNFSSYLKGFIHDVDVGESVFMPTDLVSRQKLRATIYSVTSKPHGGIYGRKFSAKAPMEKENKGKGYWIKRIK